MGVFMGGKKPDTSAVDRANQKALEERDAARAKNQAKIRNARNRARGRALMAFSQTGLTGVKDKLG